MSKKKEYIEPEVLDGNNKKGGKRFSKKSTNFNNDFVSKKINTNFSEIKRIFLLKGIFTIILYISIIAFIFFLLFGLIFLIFDTPFDYIVSAILLYFIIKGIFKMLNIFNIK